MDSLIVTFTGASGAGKSSAIKELLKRKNVVLLSSNTTRKPEERDLPGEYRYYTEEQFAFIQKGGWFLWHVEAHGFRFGTRKDDIDRALQGQGKLIVLHALAPSIRTLMRYAPGRVRPFYIHVSSPEVLAERLRGRGDATESIARRMEDCKTWDEEARQSDIPYCFVPNNKTIKKAVREILAQLPKIRP